jgi:hypothetical protein
MGVGVVTLRERQSLFAKLFAELVLEVYRRGYECTLDWGYRPPEVAEYYASIGVGIRNSLHIKKLAHDLNLFKDGVWLRQSEDHAPFGEWWERQHPLCRWGGRWGDGNHYEITER